jgi:hypothetical protein
MTPGRLSATGLTDFQIAIVRGSRHESSPDCGCRLGSLVASLALTGYLALAIALPRLGGTPVVEGPGGPARRRSGRQDARRIPRQVAT